jgi:hypothetical protein
MNECDIAELLRLLKNGIKRSDWDLVVEAVEFLEEFSDGDDEEL